MTDEATYIETPKLDSALVAAAASALNTAATVMVGNGQRPDLNDIEAEARKILARAQQLAQTSGQHHDAIYTDLIKVNKPIVGTVQALYAHKKSKRYHIYFEAVNAGNGQRRPQLKHPETGQQLPDSWERVQTLRADEVGGREQIEQIRDLRGHKVRLIIGMQKPRNNSDAFRRLISIEDLGVDPSFQKGS